MWADGVRYRGHGVDLSYRSSMSCKYVWVFIGLTNDEGVSLVISYV